MGKMLEDTKKAILREIEEELGIKVTNRQIGCYNRKFL